MSSRTNGRTLKSVIRFQPFAFAFLGSACVLCATAPRALFAAEVVVQPSLSVSETYTDNVFLAPRGLEESDWVTEISPALNVTAVGARASARLSYAPALYLYARQNEVDPRQALNASTEVEAVEDHLFIDGNAAIAYQFRSGQRGVSISDRNLSADRQRVLTLRAAPRWEHRFGPWAEASLRYSIARVDYGNVDEDVPDFYPGQLTFVTSDSTQHSVNFRVDSGDNFQRFGWSVNATHHEENRDGADADDVGNSYLEFNTKYSLNRLVAVTGMLGYQDFGFSSNSLEGVNWQVGTTLTPNRRTSLSVRYGRRTENNHFTVAGSWQPAPRTQLTISYDEDYRTVQSLVTEEAIESGQTPGGTGGGFFDSFDDPWTEIPNFPQTDDIFLRKRYSASVSHQFRMSSISFSSFREERTSNDFNDKSWGATANYTRQFSRYLSATLLGRFTNRDNVEAEQYNIYTASAQVNRSLVGSASVYAAYTLTKRTSDLPLLRLIENSFTIGLSANF